MEPGQDWKIAALTFYIYVHFFCESDIMYEKYMLEAINEAKIALSEGEVPIGSVLVLNGCIVAKSHNTRVKDCCVLGHAEINVLKDYSKSTNNWRLNDCTLYVTLLPCPMCSSAINQARIKRVICGTVPNNSNYSLIYNILNDNTYGRPVELFTGVMEDDCAELLREFFLKKR